MNYIVPGPPPPPPHPITGIYQAIWGCLFSFKGHQTRPGTAGIPSWRHHGTIRELYSAALMHVRKRIRANVHSTCSVYGGIEFKGTMSIGSDFIT